MGNIWQLQDAKNKFSQVVKNAMNHGAQIVTLRGKNAVVVISHIEYESLTRQKESLSQFLLSSPLADSELDLMRDKSVYNPIEIEP